MLPTQKMQNVLFTAKNYYFSSFIRIAIGEFQFFFLNQKHCNIINRKEWLKNRLKIKV